MASPRDRMIVSAALLIRERGAHATAISDVLEHSGAPRGSAYHHFPGGRTQLLCEAIDFAAEYVAGRISSAASSLEALDIIAEHFRNQLSDTGFRAGCPVVAVAVEADNTEVMARAAAAFTRWITQLEELMHADGIAAGRAAELAMLATTSIEGAVLVARTAGDDTALTLVHRQLRTLAAAEIAQRKA